MGLKRRKKAPAAERSAKYAAPRIVPSAQTEKVTAPEIINEDDSDVDMNSVPKIAIDHGPKSDVVPEDLPNGLSRNVSDSSMMSASPTKRPDIESKTSLLIKHIVDELSDQFGNKLLKLLNNVLAVTSSSSPKHKPDDGNSRLVMDQNEIRFFDFGGNEEWMEGCKLTQQSMQQWAETIINIGTRFAHVLAEADPLQCTDGGKQSAQSPSRQQGWQEYLCSIISARKTWSNSGFRKKSKALLTIVCDNVANKRHEIYDRFVYSKHLVNVSAVYLMYQPVQLSIAALASKPKPKSEPRSMGLDDAANDVLDTVSSSPSPAVPPPSTDTKPARRSRKRSFLEMNVDSDAESPQRKKRKILHGADSWIAKLVDSKQLRVPYASLCALHDEMNGITNLNRKRQESWIRYLVENPSYYLLLWQMTLDVPDLSTDILNLLRKPAEYLVAHKATDKHTDSSIADLMIDCDTISSVVSSHLITDFMNRYLCGPEKSQREPAKDCVQYLWRSLLFHRSREIKGQQPTSDATLCEDFVSKYCRWIRHIPSHGAHGVCYLDLLVEILSDAETVIASTSMLSDAIRTLMDCVWEQHSIAISHPLNHLYDRLKNVMPESEDTTKHHFISTLACNICHGSRDEDPQFREMPQEMRRMAKDGEIRHTHSCKVVTFKQRMEISSISLRIKTEHLAGSNAFGQRHVKTINLYFYNRQCSNPMRLKHSEWMKAKSVSIPLPDASSSSTASSNNSALASAAAASAQEAPIRLNLSVPVTALCMKIEFAAFHENDEFDGAHCPRCAAPGNGNGYCQNCGENVFQCRKCRHINFENPKGFLCVSCGYCRFASFNIQVTAKHSFDVDVIENEDNQQTVMATIGNLSASIHDTLRKMKHFAMTISNKLSAIERSDHSILHREHETNIAEIKKMYSTDCQRLHTNLASHYQKLISARDAVAQYLYQNVGSNERASGGGSAVSEANSSCYSCCIQFIEAVLKRLPSLVSISPLLRRCLVQQSSFNKLLLHSVHVPDRILRQSAKDILSRLVASDFEAAAKIGEQIKKELIQCISHVSQSRSIAEFSSPLQRYLKMLSDSVSSPINQMKGVPSNIKRCRNVQFVVSSAKWEHNMKLVFSILFFSCKNGHLSSIVVHDVITPCFQLILSMNRILPDPDLKEEDVVPVPMGKGIPKSPSKPTKASPRSAVLKSQRNSKSSLALMPAFDLDSESSRNVDNIGNAKAVFAEWLGGIQVPYDDYEEDENEGASRSELTEAQSGRRLTRNERTLIVPVLKSWMNRCKLKVDSLDQGDDEKYPSPDTAAVFDIMSTSEWLERWLLNPISATVRQNVSDLVMLICDGESNEKRVIKLLDLMAVVLKDGGALKRDEGGY